jgi:SAM-dependent methyltransferase
MQLNLIQRQYDEVIAPHYDLDPQSVIGDSLDRAMGQIEEAGLLSQRRPPLNVLDVGMGTGRFLEKLLAHGGRPVRPFGLDLSANMMDVARERIPGLSAAIGDAADLDLHFPSQSFDLISTHFITGFVSVDVLAPKIWDKLDEGGHWSLVGGTKGGFPRLRRTADAKKLRWLFRGKRLDVDEFVTNPAGREEVVRAMEANGFVVRRCVTFEPDLYFADFDEFLEFAYWGGWLTPFVEALGLHQARPMIRLLLNALAFPISDHHSIEVVLAQKTARRPRASEHGIERQGERG